MKRLICAILLLILLLPAFPVSGEAVTDESSRDQASPVPGSSGGIYAYIIPSEKGKYVSEIKVGGHKDANSARGFLKGYTLIDFDLNRSARGYFIFLGL